jgi:hypothetical protein
MNISWFRPSVIERRVAVAASASRQQSGDFNARHIGDHSVMVGVQTMRLFVF